MTEHDAAPGGTDPRAGVSTLPEDTFVEIFAQVFGIEKTQLLAPEYPVADVDGNTRFIDFALKSAGRLIAFEIDGPSHYQPPGFTLDKFEDDVDRQNSLIHQGWQVFRWSDRQLAKEPNRIKDQLILFLERVPGLLELSDFLPRQSGAAAGFDLRTHQRYALEWLAEIRAQGKTIGLLEHATGSGKTVTAITDAKRIGPRVLYVAHRKPLVEQTAREFRRLWPEATHGRIVGGVWEPEPDIVCASIQSIGRRLSELPPDAFRYLIIDEAHHAAAPGYQTLLGHFSPAFTLGLTATPDRPDGRPILEVFRDAAHRLTLEEAIRSGELVPIRCVRVKTNLDLSRVRFNEVSYNRHDLEQTISVPARNDLILDTYLHHVPGRKGVTFCVNVRHAEEMAMGFLARGVPARAVSGAMRAEERESILRAFAGGDLKMLCACDILNEGWDCPDVEVLLMARPTLSKIVYMQQLGRGTRKAPGKESLIVFDFVDNAGRYSQSWSIHRLTKTTTYRPGGYVLAPETRIAEERARGLAPPVLVNIGLWTEGFEEIDVFDWQSEVKDMLSSADLELALAASEGYLRDQVLNGRLQADHTLEIGTRRYFYFQKDRKSEIAKRFGLTPVTAANIWERFLAFCEEMDMAASYKPVFLLCLLNTVDEDGTVPIASLTHAFRDFYLDRLARDLPAERPRMRMARAAELTESEIQRLILDMPFRKFAQRGFIDYARDVSTVRFASALWRRITLESNHRLRDTSKHAIERYYALSGPERDPSGGCRCGG